MHGTEAYLRTFYNLQHILENIGVGSIFAYFAFIKAPPAHLKDDRLTSMKAMGGIMKAKAAFKRPLKLKKKET